jgi:hypothetical protein
VRSSLGFLTGTISFRIDTEERGDVMKKMWLLGSASLLICAGVAVCNVQASSVMTDASSGETSFSQTARTREASNDVLSLPASRIQRVEDTFNMPASGEKSFDSPSSSRESSPISERSFILLLSAVAALCLLRRRDSTVPDQLAQRQYRSTTLWNRPWTTQASQDSA